MFHLDHMALGVPDFDRGVRKLTEETGLGSYPGGVFSGGLSNWIFPLGGDVYLEVEGITGVAEGPAEWFRRATADGGDRWMFWCLRADTREELDQVAARLGSEVQVRPGRREPDGTQRVITSTPSGEVARRARQQGLPNWYYREDPAKNPARREVAGDRAAAGVAWLEVAGDRALFREHIGAETFDRLPLRFVPGEPGLHAVAVRTAEGGQLVIRRAPAGQDTY
ncbi:VOC family protein [Amycolatopsis sp. PS_44_ISF1]|uniref:VOC family protein n=1 Tax=Amycolatopsis sp. PS_44_ISF1 TaxID=2974917 RepID=UPI0028DF183F|nr:VOC family protein [Amycolatopsis sp. PS_44_ISF1]MDT8915451.1 VOC family protein [Amycolatopsis sp. PS_44_ISF1]